MVIRVSLTGWLLVCASAVMGCSAATWQGVAAGLAAASGETPVAATGGSKLMLFGGSGHRTYLGCINCSEYAADSILNSYGSFGSQYGTTSITNQFSQFGSPYSAYSACNPYATDPPVIVDAAGNSYGRLTVNQGNSQRTRNDTLLTWLAVVCAK